MTDRTRAAIALVLYTIRGHRFIDVRDETDYREYKFYNVDTVQLRVAVIASGMYLGWLPLFLTEDAPFTTPRFYYSFAINLVLVPVGMWMLFLCFHGVPRSLVPQSRMSPSGDTAVKSCEVTLTVSTSSGSASPRKSASESAASPRRSQATGAELEAVEAMLSSPSKRRGSMWKADSSVEAADGTVKENRFMRSIALRRAVFPGIPQFTPEGMQMATACRMDQFQRHLNFIEWIGMPKPTQTS